MIRKSLILYILVISMVFMSGCDIQIFEDKSSKYIAKALNRNELETGNYYVKRDTKFFKIHPCQMSSESSELDSSKSAWTILDETLIPDYYCNELIAKPAASVEKEAVTLERYKDCGYSIGVYGAVFLDGFISFSTNNNIIDDTEAAKRFENDRSDNILIETINGVPVNEEMLNEAGIILGMEKDQSYEITFFAGTYYGKTVVKAETHFLQSFEIYNVDNYELTKNGYVAIRLPDDLECGYYRFDNSGFFRYYNFKREDSTAAKIDFNIPYYDSEEDQMAAYSQQFVFNLDVNTADMSVKADFDSLTVTNANGIVKMMLTSPDGKRMLVETNKDEGTISCGMVESMPGKWIVNIAPQSMTVSDVQIVSNKDETEATKESFDIAIEEDMTGVIFTMEYSGPGVVTAQILDELNNSYDMVQEDYHELDRIHTMKYNFAYLPKGNYKVNVYHYPDTKIHGASYEISEAVREVEIITVEE